MLSKLLWYRLLAFKKRAKRFLRCYLRPTLFCYSKALNLWNFKAGTTMSPGNILHQGSGQGVKMIVVSSANLGQSITRPTTVTMAAGANVPRTVALGTGGKMAIGGTTQILNSGQIFTLAGKSC